MRTKMADSPTTISSPGTRRNTPSGSVQRQTFSPLSPAHRPEKVQEGVCRGGGNLRTSEREELLPTELRLEDLSEQAGWVKASWKKGECREEIKLIADASGLTFDDARTVALRLYNHFNWLPQLKERWEQLFAAVGREKRLSLMFVRKEALAAPVPGLARCVTADSADPVDAGGLRSKAIILAEEGNCDTIKDQFARYVRGLCTISNEGSFDQMLDVLFRAYSTTRDDCTITRTEMAALLSKHVIYKDSKDPDKEKERVYRWLKRQFINLKATTSPTDNLGMAKDIKKQQGIAVAADPATTTTVAAGRNQDGGGCISWDSARELLRRGPQCLEDSIAIDLPCLSKDLWTADLVDMGRTSLTSSLQ